MISLKAYNRDIEQLIDNGLYDEAIAHCIHILATFPKCIESYRNLGKSLLEQKKYSEALDVFSRVISAIPDDFISHVGLSIIFEDQNNLDLAIWHMEQAFDVQPSNLAIQDELKRLFGRRDGEQPGKIRLTRGALVRMYARGELFQQAITEILSILEEDPRRVDLEVILARMHYFSGAIEESAEICNSIIEKYPFCFEANRILQQIHINKNENEAASINFNCLASLDPYYQFAPSPFSDQEIPENKVLLEKLDYIPSISTESHLPVWKEDFEEVVEGKPTEAFTWMNNSNEPTVINNVDPFSINDQQFKENADNNDILSDDEIPDWMKTAGWKMNLNDELQDGSNKPNPNLNHPLESNIASDSIAKANDLPVELGSNVTNEDLASLFTELKEGKMVDDNLGAIENPEKQFPPSDWMSQFSNNAEKSSSNSSDGDFPDWLKNFQAEEPQVTNESNDIPDWLKDLQTDVEPISSSDNGLISEELPINNTQDETTFDNLFIQNESQDETLSLNEVSENNLETEDGWEKIDLTSSPLSEPVNQENIQNEPIQNSSDDKIPDWVKSILVNQNTDDQNTLSPITENSVDTEDTQPIDQSNTSASTYDESNISTSDTSDGIISQQTNDELLDWLRGLKTEEEVLPQPEENLFISDPIIDQTNEQVEDFSDLDRPFDLAVTKPEEELIPTEEEQSDIFEPRNEIIDSEDSLTSELVSDETPELIVTDMVNESSTDVFEKSANFDQTPKIQTSELKLESALENSEDEEIQNILEMISKGEFDKLTKKLSEIVVHDEVSSAIILAADEQASNFSYWQFLGDFYSKENRLNEALSAYQKAEDILVKTIS